MVVKKAPAKKPVDKAPIDKRMMEDEKKYTKHLAKKKGK
jgi:hypothetical protein